MGRYLSFGGRVIVTAINDRIRDHGNSRDETIRIYGRRGRHEDSVSRAI